MSSQSQVSQPGLPKSFDPFKTHPFTNISRAPQPVPAPSPYPRPIRAYQPPYNLQDPSSSTTSPSSLPTAQTPVHSPQPQLALPSSKRTNNGSSPAANAIRHVFEPFKLDRASPELQDVLVKKGTKSPPTRRSPGTSPGSSANDAKRVVKNTK